MDEFSYRTVEQPTEGLFKEKGSRFIAFAYPVADEAAIKKCLLDLRKRFFDARHHCYAWVLGADRCTYRSSDDGEPNHSAGDPILGQIKSLNLTNVLVVVVRYFGGVKLGVGGLIVAYRTAARDALDKAQIIEKEVTRELTFNYQYESTASMMRLVKEFEMSVVAQKYEKECELKVVVKTRYQQKLHERLDFLNFL